MARPRVFEYVDEEGNLFWSLSELKGRVTSGKVLVLQNRLGKSLVSFLQDVRREWALFFSGDDETV